MEFSDVKFMTAKEKAGIYSDWKKFIDSDFNISKFTKRLYNHLHLHCNHIAHYDLHGFYDAQFSTIEHRQNFLVQLVQDQMSGRLSWGAGIDYADINSALVDHVIVCITA